MKSMTEDSVSKSIDAPWMCMHSFLPKVSKRNLLEVINCRRERDIKTVRLNDLRPRGGEDVID